MKPNRHTKLCLFWVSIEVKWLLCMRKSDKLDAAHNPYIQLSVPIKLASVVIWKLFSDFHDASSSIFEL